MSYGLIKPLFGTPISPTHPLGPAGGMVACWPMNENSGNKIYDASGYGNHGTLTNMADPPTPTSGWGPGPHGGALAFDDTSTLITPAIIGSFIDYTILFFLTITAVSNYNLVGSFGGTYYYLTYGDVTYRLVDTPFNVTTPSTGIFGSSTSASFLNKLACIAFVRQAGTTYAYREGVFSASALSAGGTGTNPILQMGNSLSGRNMIGTITSVSIYNRALSDLEVAILYARPYCMFEDAGYPAWMSPNNIPQMMNYYRQMRAA